MGRDPAKIMSALLTYIPGFGNFCQAFRPIANEKVFHGRFSLIIRRVPFLKCPSATASDARLALTRRAV
jgi:hypothetical protein